MALQCHLLRRTLLHQNPAGDAARPEDGEDGTQESMQELQASLVSLASEVFTGAFQVGGQC